jgi:predicted kinase
LSSLGCRLPASGNSSIARASAREIGAIWLWIDPIEQAIRVSGVVPGSLEDAGYRAAYAVTFGFTPLLFGAELAVAAGDRVCLVGRNGSGKSTLLRIAAASRRLVRARAQRIAVHNTFVFPGT